MELKGKKILLGVTGGIAAYKSAELLRLLQKQGAEVRVVMTPAATRFVTPLTFASLSKCPVYTQDGAPEARPYQHIDFPRWADLYLVVPCTANTLGKMANGLADDPVSLCFMSCAGEKWIAPAMNTVMFLSPAVQANLKSIRKFPKVHVLESPSGMLACGEEGPGRCAEPASIVKALLSAPENNKPILGSSKSVLITAGRTEEAIDPVRYISNRSSGKTALALALAFKNAGFSVTVVSGPMEAPRLSGIEWISVKSALEMHHEVLSRISRFDVLVHAAAVADYRPKTVSDQKIKDSRSHLTLELEPNPNILRDSVAKKHPGQIIVGFALETADAERHAKEKWQKSGADLLVLNTPVAKDSGFGFDQVSYSLISKEEPVSPPQMGSKDSLAQKVVSFVLTSLGGNSCQ